MQINTNVEQGTNAPDGYEANRIHSESCVKTIGELSREEANNNNRRPPRSSTEPNSASPTTQKGKQSTATSGDTLVGSSSSSEDSGILKRLPFGHRKSGEAPDLEKSESRVSKTTTRKSKKQENLPVKHQLKAVFWSWPNILLICVPIGIALNYAGGINPLAIFIVCPSFPMTKATQNRALTTAGKFHCHYTFGWYPIVRYRRARDESWRDSRWVTERLVR